MKRIIIMRHAKSDWSAGAGSDHERPLNPRGKREAPLVAAALRASGVIPERVLSSDSTRTRETWAHMADQFEGAEVTYDAKLYLAGIDATRAALAALDDVLREAPRETTAVLVLGHNPGWEDMVTELARRRIELKTAHAAVFEATREDLPWAELLSFENLKLARIVTAGDD